jgi:anti-sigma regulatory factor (Ser/Thr protein kinase)
VKTLASGRAVVPPDAVSLSRSAARRSTRSVVDLVADVRTLTDDAGSAAEQRDQALRALAATVVAIREGWSTPLLFALPLLTRLGLVPEPGADPHEILTGAPWWGSLPGSAARDLHADDEVGGGLRRLAVLAVDPHSAQVGRWLVTAVEVDWALPAEVAEDARLVVSELVTNSLLHADFTAGADAITLEVAWSADRRELTIAVGDPDPRLPETGTAPSADAVRSPATHSGEGGAGLLIVRALAERWSVDATEDGKCVTAVLATPAGGAR